jgi:hypothetical protein
MATGQRTSASILEGRAAIEYARRNNAEVSKYADPVEDARDMTPDDADRICDEYPGTENLFWTEVRP